MGVISLAICLSTLGSCLYLGCTNSGSPLYNPSANRDDGSCPTISGCTNPAAENYQSYATNDDGSCSVIGCTPPFAVSPYGGGCYLPIPGCRDSRSENYLSVANTGGTELSKFDDGLDLL